jgi:hypothetical protein
MADFRAWPAPCFLFGMFDRVRRLFTIKTKFEAYLVIYGLGTGAVERGMHYLDRFPGWGGMALFLLCPIAVFMAGAKILDTFDIPR